MRIKTKVIQTPKGRLLVVGGLPENEEILRIVSGCLTAEKQDDNLTTTDYAIPSGNWQLLGKLPDITEEQAKEVVLDLWIGGFGERYFHQNSKNSLGNYVHFKTAKEALLSLVESEVSLKNRLGEYPTEESTGLEYGMEYLSKVDDWEEEQDKIFTNPVLFWEPQSK